MKIVLLLCGIGLLAGCGVREDPQTARTKFANAVNQVIAESSVDQAAIGFLDCNELKYVVFLNSRLQADAIFINSPTKLLDVQVRLAQVEYERVNWISNDRPCGFKADATDIKKAIASLEAT